MRRSARVTGSIVRHLPAAPVARQIRAPRVLNAPGAGEVDASNEAHNREHDASDGRGDWQQQTELNQSASAQRSRVRQRNRMYVVITLLHQLETCAAATIAPNSAGEIVPAFICAKPSMAF